MNYLPLVNRKYRNGPTWRQDGRTRYRTTHSKHSIIKQNEETFHFDTILIPGNDSFVHDIVYIKERQ